MTKGNPQPFYDPAKTFDDNFDHGPFGDLEQADRFENEGEPKYTFLGQPVYSPFGIAAGPLPNSRFVKAAMRRGFDVVTYKTQRTDVFACNDFPNVLYVEVDGDLTLEKAAKPLVGRTKTSQPREDFTITNSFGNPSRGPEFWVPDLKRAVVAQGRGQLVIVSVVGTIAPGFSNEDYYNDFANAARLAAGTGVQAIEVNLSCPNVANEGVLCYTPEAVREITRRVKAAIGDVPLVAKLGYFAPEQAELLETVVRAMLPQVAAIAAINTIPAAVVDERGQQALPGPNRLSSGLCGASIKWAGLEMVARLAKLRQKTGSKYEIIGVGGVMKLADYRAYREAGADCVQSCTGAMWNPNLAAEIKRG